MAFRPFAAWPGGAPSTHHTATSSSPTRCGEGDIDVVLVPSFVSHIEFLWAPPAVKAFFDRVASFARGLVSAADPEGVTLERAQEPAREAGDGHPAC